MTVRAVLLAFFFAGASAFAQTSFNQPCPAHTVPDRTATICTPTQGSQVPGSFFLVAHVTDSLSFTSTLFFDGINIGGGAGLSDIQAEIGSFTGSHRITLNVQDSSGTFSTSILVNEITTGQTPCAPSTTNQTLVICTPQDGNQETSPVELAAVTTDSNPLNATQVYVDGVKAAEGNGNEANYVLTHLILPTGPHRVTFQALEKSGLIIRKTINISVR
jgi:hypothetical protein